MSNESDIQQGFIRQRRNLLLISVLLCFIYGAGVVITRINILGNVAVIENPDKVYLFLWIGWLYFLIRYIVYYVDIGTKGWHDRILKGTRALEKNNIEKILVRDLFKASEPKKFLKNNNIFLTYTNVSDIGEQDGKRVFQLHDVSYINPNDGKKIARSELKVQIETRYLFQYKVKSFFKVFFTTRLFTEYVLPFIVATFPIITYVVYR